MAVIQTLPASPDRWGDIVTAFGRRGNDPDWCWCQRFMEPGREATTRDGTTLDGATPHGTTRASNRDVLHREIESAAVPPGVLAYVDGAPVGWSRVMPRRDVPLVQKNRALRPLLDDDPDVWWITCFAVDRRHRSRGVATALLDAAAAHAASHGATALEGHPVDTDALKAERVAPSALFTGTMRTFVACGFHEIGRTYPSRPVMRRHLGGADRRPVLRRDLRP